PRPNGVEVSFWLWVTYLAIGAINAVIGFVQRDRNRADAISAVAAQYPAMDRAMIEKLANTVVLGLVVTGVLFVVASFTCALLMRGGRNWARILLTVVGSLGIPFMIHRFGTELQLMFQILLLAAAIAMMYLPPVNEWFRPRRRQI